MDAFLQKYDCTILILLCCWFTFMWVTISAGVYAQVTVALCNVALMVVYWMVFCQGVYIDSVRLVSCIVSWHSG